MKKSYVGKIMLLALVLVCSVFSAAFAETDEGYPEDFDFRFEGTVDKEEADQYNAGEAVINVEYGDGSEDQGRTELVENEELYMGTKDKVVGRLVRYEDTKLVKVKGPCGVDVKISNPAVMSYEKYVENEGALSQYGCTYYFKPAGTTGCSHVSFTTSLVGGKTNTFDFCFQEGPVYLYPDPFNNPPARF